MSNQTFILWQDSVKCQCSICCNKTTQTHSLTYLTYFQIIALHTCLYFFSVDICFYCNTCNVTNWNRLQWQLRSAQERAMSHRHQVSTNALQWNGCLSYRKLFMSLTLQQEVVFIIKLLFEKLSKAQNGRRSHHCGALAPLPSLEFSPYRSNKVQSRSCIFVLFVSSPVSLTSSRTW